MSDFVLPMPPSTNRLYRNWNGRQVKSTEARTYSGVASMRAFAQGVRPLDCPVALTLVFYFIRSNADLNNRVKCLEDSLIGVAYIDDKQVVMTTTVKLEAARVKKARKGEKQLKRQEYVLVRVVPAVDAVLRSVEATFKGVQIDY